MLIASGETAAALGPTNADRVTDLRLYSAAANARTIEL
jgi:hypothetical protein